MHTYIHTFIHTQVYIYIWHICIYVYMSVIELYTYVLYVHICIYIYTISIYMLLLPSVAGVDGTSAFLSLPTHRGQEHGSTFCLLWSHAVPGLLCAASSSSGFRPSDPERYINCSLVQAYEIRCCSSSRQSLLQGLKELGRED